MSSLIFFTMTGIMIHICKDGKSRLASKPNKFEKRLKVHLDDIIKSCKAINQMYVEE